MCDCANALVAALATLAAAAVINIIATIIAWISGCGMCSAVKAATKKENPTA